MTRLPRKKPRAVFGQARSPPVDQAEEREKGGLGKNIKWKRNREGKSINGMWIAFEFFADTPEKYMLLRFFADCCSKRGKFVMLRVHLWSFSVKRKIWAVIFLCENLQVKESGNKRETATITAEGIINC